MAIFAGAAQAHQNDPCQITLTPETALNILGKQPTHSVTAYVTRKGGDSEAAPGSSTSPGATCKAGGGGPLAGVTVHFVITSGPNAGKTADVVTDADGKAVFTWTGTVPGLDTVSASTTYNFDEWSGTDPSNPATGVQCTKAAQPTSIAIIYKWTCSETLTDTATKTWENPPTVIATYVPTVTMALSTKCHTNKFKIGPSITPSSNVKSSSLYVDGKLVSTKTTGPFVFTVNAKRYSAGRSHRVTVITQFDNGQSITTKGKFKNCAARVTQRRVSPKFTG